MAKRLKWGTVDFLQTKVNEYFDECYCDDITKRKAPTIAGICLYINITKSAWFYYTSDINKWKHSYRSPENAGKTEEEKIAAIDEESAEEVYEEWLEVTGNNKCLDCDNAEDGVIKSLVSQCLKKAKLRVEEFNNQMLYGKTNPLGAIFYLNNAFGYQNNPDNKNDSAAITGNVIAINIQLDKSEDEETKALVAGKTET